MDASHDTPDNATRTRKGPHRALRTGGMAIRANRGEAMGTEASVNIVTGCIKVVDTFRLVQVEDVGGAQEATGIAVGAVLLKPT